MFMCLTKRGPNLIKARISFLLAMTQNSKGHKLYNPSMRKTIISRDMKFDKENTWERNSQEEEYDSLPLLWRWKWATENETSKWRFARAHNSTNFTIGKQTSWYNTGVIFKWKFNEEYARSKEFTRDQWGNWESEWLDFLLSLCWFWAIKLSRSYKKQQVARWNR